MEIPIATVAMLGFGATAAYLYKVMNGDIKSIGAFASTLYLTIVYLLLLVPDLIGHGSPFVRLGILLVFLDKIIVFAYSLLHPKFTQTFGYIISKVMAGLGGRKNG
jgi:hypothetical protein